MVESIINLDKISEDICKKLTELAKDPGNVKDYSRFYKDDKKHIGLDSKVAKKFSSEKFKEIRNLDKKNILSLCERLLEFGSYAKSIAFDWASKIRKQYSGEDFAILERWLDKYVHDWSDCDDLCTHALGYFLFDFPEVMPIVYRWVKSENKWKRRASAVVLIYSLRRNKCIEDAIETAKLLLNDKEDLVQKGYGWMLKEASKFNQERVFSFVTRYKDVMPRTALRYAIEKMPTSLKEQAMRR